MVGLYSVYGSWLLLQYAISCWHLNELTVQSIQIEALAPALVQFFLCL